MEPRTESEARKNWTRRLLRLAATLLFAGLLAATLARFAPGYDFDEDQLDSRRSEESRARLRAARSAEGNLAEFFPLFLAGLARGEWGQSQSLHRPVRELISERAALTTGGLAAGLALGWTAALLAGLTAARYRHSGAAAWGTAASVLAQCVPAGLCAFLMLAAGVRGQWALAFCLAAIVFGRLFPYFLNLLETVRRKPAVVMARAKGVGPWRLVLHHVLRVSAPQMLSLTSVAAAAAISACVPLEMILDQPGLGQLAWQAAIARDLPLLVMVTWILGAVLMVLSACADGTVEGLRNP